MKPKVLIKDLLDELSDENQRLFNELTICQQLWQLFDNYRQLLSNFSTNCLCIENNTFRQQLNDLEMQYMSLKNNMKKKSLSKKISATDNHKEDEEEIEDNKLLTNRQRVEKSTVKSRLRRRVVDDNKDDDDYTSDTTDDNDNNNSTSTDIIVDEMRVTFKRCKTTNKTTDRTPAGRKKSFVCDYNGCDKRFTEKEFFLQHYRVKHTNERPFVCQDCDKGFPTAQTLKNHMKTKHPADHEFRCPIIGCSFRTQVLQKLYDHNQSHKPKNGTKRVRKLMPRKYVCDWIGCGKPFSQRANLEIHIRSQHTKETPFTCEDCGKVFTNKSCLKSHTALHSSDMKFICKHVGCGYKTRTPQALYRHQLTHRPKRPTIIGEQRRKRINKLNYSCEVVGCTKQFQRHEQLVAHIRNRHTNERPFRCDLCDTRFVIERYVDIHKRTVHSDAPLMKCTLDGCAYETRFQSRLDQHLRRHDGNPEFVCPNHGCGKQFYTKRSLNLHLQSHSDERPFPCNWPGCDKRFKNNQQLKVHLERHSGVRSYRCSLPGCDKSYTTHKGLEQHSRSHSIPYQCTWPACEARFQNSSKLKDHMNGHQGIKPFNCHFQGCDVSYSSKDSLRMHWRQTHKYIKTYHDKT